MEIRTPLYDEQGNLLLARNQIIDSPSLLQALKEHPALFTDELALRQTVRAVMASFEEAYRHDEPLSSIPRAGVAAAPGEPEPELPEPARPREAETPAVPLDERWRILESRLGGILASLSLGGAAAREALPKLMEFYPLLQRLWQHNPASAALLLFNRTVSSFNGYCALHSLHCAVLAMDVSQRLPVSPAEARSLTLAALSMNASIKALQDQLAQQKGKASQDQLQRVARHGIETAELLSQAGVQDRLWLEVVSRHHDDLPYCPAINDRPPPEKLAKILQVIDRFTAALSPRGSRPARPAREAVKTVIRDHNQAEHDEVGLDLMLNLGLYPPGTYVQLERGETAVSLMRGPKPDQPVVATVLNRHGEPVLEPRLIHTSEEGQRVVLGLSGSQVKVKPNEAALIRLLQNLRSAIRR